MAICTAVNGNNSFTRFHARAAYDRTNFGRIRSIPSQDSLASRALATTEIDEVVLEMNTEIASNLDQFH